MKTLCVNLPNKKYDILIEKNLLSKAGNIIQERLAPSKAVVITDENVDALYGNKVTESIRSAGISVKKIVLPSGETTKCLLQLSHIYSEALSFSITRKDIIVALGGGVIGDLAGFAAATLLRGIPLVQIPTTLLAQVDSSVGGKVAIDVPEGKNLVGAFYQPKLVITDPETLHSLSDRIFFDGLAEVIKYGLIADKKLFTLLQSCNTREEICQHINDIIYTCCDLKRAVVEADELDTGLRMILNFGHTLAHVAEKQYHYETYTHGQAVAFGMVQISKIGEKIGLTPIGTSAAIETLITRFGLPAKIPLATDIQNTLALDKKSMGNEINIVLLSEIGKAFTHKMSLNDFYKSVKDIL